MSVERRTPAGTFVLSAIAFLGGDGTSAANPFLDVAGAVHDDALRECDERGPLWRLSGAPATQRRGIYSQAGGKVVRGVPSVGQEGLFAVRYDKAVTGGAVGVTCGLLLVVSFSSASYFQLVGQVCPLSGGSTEH
jgi:hypothetical protein